MFEALKNEIAKHGHQAAIVPIQRLQNIRQDLVDLNGRNELNNFQHYILDSIYQLDLPAADFEIRSILLVATPSPAAIKLQFTQHGKRVQALLPATYATKDSLPGKLESYLTALLNPSGYHVLHASRLPHKLLAVRSGLGRYGRNNICYVEGMGSFLNVTPFFTDLPCTEDTWQVIQQMDLCKTCRVCLQNCPTGAIMPTRFLINNERCLTYFNEAGAAWDFPNWIDPSAHHTIYGCLRCQLACPVNQPHLSDTIETIEFSEAETASLCEGKALDLLPEALQQKVTALEMTEYLGAIPRNLRVLFNQV